MQHVYQFTSTLQRLSFLVALIIFSLRCSVFLISSVHVRQILWKLSSVAIRVKEECTHAAAVQILQKEQKWRIGKRWDLLGLFVFFFSINRVRNDAETIPRHAWVQLTLQPTIETLSSPSIECRVDHPKSHTLTRRILHRGFSISFYVWAKRVEFFFVWKKWKGRLVVVFSRWFWRK